MTENKLKEIIIHEDKCTGCRICQLICSLQNQKRFQPDKAYIKIYEEYELIPKILFLNNCTKCGQCALHCLYGALELIGGDF